MNWDAIGAIGEVIGALAVFLTLGYLAVQIRQNTKAVRASALDSSVNAVNAVRFAVFESAEVTAIYRKGLANPDELDDNEKTRFRLLVHTVLWSIWNIYAQTEYGGLSTSTWAAQIPLLDRIMNSQGGVWFWDNFKMEFDEKFRDEVDKVMEGKGSGL
jgi:hypothetical protein